MMPALPSEVFDLARSFMPAGFAWDRIAPWGELAPIAGMIVGRAPVILSHLASFRLHPAMESAPSWRWHAIVAVRQGPVPRRADSFPAFYDSQDNETDEILRRVQALVRSGWVGDLPPALFGRRIVDCVALDRMTTGPILGRLAGVAEAVGLAPAWGEEPGPVRVNGSVRAWLAARCDGIVPLGTAAERQAVLLRCRGGLVAADRRQGLALRRLMRRPLLPVPDVFLPA